MNSNFESILIQILFFNFEKWLKSYEFFMRSCNTILRDIWKRSRRLNLEPRDKQYFQNHKRQSQKF